MSKFTVSMVAVISFLLGALMSYLAMTKQHMDKVLGANVQSAPSPQVNTADSNAVNPAIVTTDGLVSQNMADGQRSNEQSSINNPQTVSVKDYSQEQAQAIIDDMPDMVLSQYIDKFMAKDASSEIADKRRFAQRAIEELYTANDNQPLAGEIKLSFDSTMPSQSVDLSTIDKDAKVYAHLDTQGKVPASPYVFVKWVNNQTGQVLLFEKKDIVADQNQNWVSFRPYDGWQVGSYDIRFYQFTSELQPIAQLTYNIYTVNDSGSSTSSVGSDTVSAKVPAQSGQ